MSADLVTQPSTALSALNESQIATLLEVLGIPDVTAVHLDAASPQDKVEICQAYKAQLTSALAIVAELTDPVRAIIARCNADILNAIPAGASMLPQANFDVKKNLTYERMRDVATLRADLPQTELPAEELAKIVYVKSIDARTVDPDDLDRLVKNGAKVDWDCDLRKADMAARTYGGEIAEIIQKATRKVEKGAPFLTITPKESALKRVGQ